MEKDNEHSKNEENMGEQDKWAKEMGIETLKVLEYPTWIPYQAKVKKDQQEEQFKKFLDMFKTLHINHPVCGGFGTSALYAKFLKESPINKK